MFGAIGLRSREDIVIQPIYPSACAAYATDGVCAVLLGSASLKWEQISNHGTSVFNEVDFRLN